MVNIDFCLTKRSLETFQLEKMVSTKEVKKNSSKWQQSRRDCKSMKQVFNIFKESKIFRSIKSLYEVRGGKASGPSTQLLWKHRPSHFGLV